MNDLCSTRLSACTSLRRTCPALFSKCMQSFQRESCSLETDSLSSLSVCQLVIISVQSICAILREASFPMEAVACGCDAVSSVQRSMCMACLSIVVLQAAQAAQPVQQLLRGSGTTCHRGRMRPQQPSVL